ncbi:MAG TPA: hypothetical protein VJG90_01925 [Candidatus Nanoarchaeia archaeon]|nr:hypothetical protein [Candidatus Nanoarchaeia archaeon]
MGLDQQLYRLPFIGKIINRLYSYFKKHTAFTDFIHVLLGLGLGFIIAGGTLLNWGLLFLAIGLLGHIYAFTRG